MKKQLSTLVLPLIMIGCGGGGSSSTVGTGYYVDSAVNGAQYACGNQSGTTDAQGMFKFESGKTCQFSINSQTFKTVAASSLTDGVTIQETDVNIARFLLTMDNDGNGDNGITISSETAAVVTKVPQTDTDFAVLNAALHGVSSYQGSTIDKKAAEEHLGATKIEAKVTVSSNTIKQGESITLSAATSTISKGQITSYLWTDNNQRVSTEESFTSNTFTLGTHTLTLRVKNAEGLESTANITFNVTTAIAPTKWDNITALDNTGNTKLFMTSDADNLYLKLESDEDMSNVQFFIDSDDSRISGLQTSSYGNEGFNYKLTADGLFRLKNAGDFTGALVQAMSYTITNNTLEIAIDKDNIDYLAETIPVVVFFGPNSTLNVPVDGSVQKFTDTAYDANQADTVAPIITVTNDSVAEVVQNTAYVDAGATAMDIRDGGAVTVTTNSSAVNMAQGGYYTVNYTARDAANNIANASRIVHVSESAPASTLEIKDLGVQSESVVINHQTGLVWANDNTDEPVGGGNTRGCIIFGTGVANLKSAFENYCTESDYAGFKDWRLPNHLEMTQFTVQMFQEGKTPGMARKGCTRTLSLDVSDSDKVVAIWTHNMNQPGFYDETTLTPAGGRCVRGTAQVNIGSFTPQSIGVEKDKVMIDNDANLMWVNESAKSKLACLAIHFDKPAEYNTSKTFCGVLNHAGFMDWRDPNPAEVSNFIIKTNAVHILPGYEAPCKALLARDVNGSEFSISTRFDTSKMLGTTNTLVTPLTSNIGLRCVRDN